MPKYGFQITPSYIPEDAQGTPTSFATPLRFPGIVQDAKTTSKWNVKQYRGFKIAGATDQRQYDLIVPAKNEYDFTLQYIPIKRLSSPKYDFRHFLGFAMNASSSTTAGGAWTYATNLASNLSNFTLYKQTGGLTEQTNGCTVSRFQGKSSVDNTVEFMVEGTGTLATYASLNRTSASTLTGGTPFMWSDVTCYINGSLATNVTAFEFTINNFADTQHTLGNRDPRLVYPKGREIDIKFTRFFNDTNDYANAKAGNLDAITLQFADTGNPQLLFRNCVREDYVNPSDVEKLLVNDFVYKCRNFSLNP